MKTYYISWVAQSVDLAKFNSRILTVQNDIFPSYKDMEKLIDEETKKEIANLEFKTKLLSISEVPEGWLDGKCNNTL